MKSRIKHVMRFRKQKAHVAALAAAVCVFCAACLSANPKGDANGETMAETETETGQTLSISETEEAPPVEADLAIRNAIMDYHAGNYAHSDEYDFACCDFVSLASRASDEKGAGRTVTYYGWAYYAEYVFSEYGIEETGGSHIPVALTFTDSEDGYRLKEYWEPGDGSYFVSDVKEKFPGQIAEDGIDSQKFVLRQIQDCYAQAVAYGDLDTDVILEHLLEVICSDPKESSNPQDYIRAHDMEYRELLYYGEFTVDYCSTRFANGDETGLEGHVMARVCEELLGTKGKLSVDAGSASTGQEWHDALSSYVVGGIKKEEDEILAGFGVPVALPQNESWILNPNVAYLDENRLRIEYYDGILEGRCELRAAKDGEIDLPELEEGREADETWEGETRSGQTVTARVYRLERRVIATWEYENCAFAIVGDALAQKEDVSSVPKAALEVIRGLE